MSVSASGGDPVSARPEPLGVHPGDPKTVLRHPEKHPKKTPDNFFPPPSPTDIHRTGRFLVHEPEANSTCRPVETALERQPVSNCFGRGSLGERTGSGKPKKGKAPGRGPFGGLCRVRGPHRAVPVLAALKAAEDGGS